MLILSNALSALGIVSTLLSSAMRDKSKMLYFAVITALFNAGANFVAGSHAMAVATLCIALRYYAVFKKLNPHLVCAIFIPITLYATLHFNTEGLWVICPLVSATTATIVLSYVQNMIPLKAILTLLNVVNTAHDLHFRLYLSAGITIVCIIESIIVIYRLVKEQRLSASSS